MEENTPKRGRPPGRKSRAERAAEMTGSPEFSAAVDAAVQAALAPLMAKLGTARQVAGSEQEPGDKRLMEQLAMSIAELTTQGTGRVKVAPDVLQFRADERERMVNLIIEARAEGKIATYQLRNKIHIDDRIVEPMWIEPGTHAVKPTEIDFNGIPNEAMVPVNDTAQAIFAAFKNSIGITKGVPGVAHLLPPEDRLGITPKGVVVRNGAVNNAIARATPELPVYPPGQMPAYEAPQVGDGVAAPSVVIKHEAGQGRFKDVRVLGTIMRPAQQNV